MNSRFEEDQIQSKRVQEQSFQDSNLVTGFGRINHIYGKFESLANLFEFKDYEGVHLAAKREYPQNELKRNAFTLVFGVANTLRREILEYRKTLSPELQTRLKQNLDDMLESIEQFSSRNEPNIRAIINYQKG